jgi:hypothetical protein
MTETDRIIMDRERRVTEQMKKWAVGDAIAREIVALDEGRVEIILAPSDVLAASLVREMRMEGLRVAEQKELEAL